MGVSHSTSNPPCSVRDRSQLTECSGPPRSCDREVHEFVSPSEPSTAWASSDSAAELNKERYKYFRWTPRTARINFMYVIFVPSILGYLFYYQDVRLNTFREEYKMIYAIIRANGI